MNERLKILLFTFFLMLLAGKDLPAQNQVIDSLKTLIKIQQEDTEKVNTLNELSEKLINIGEYQTALNHALEAKSLAEKFKFKPGISSSYINTGLIYKYQGNYPEALKNYFTALKIDEEIGNKAGIASSYNNIGIIYKNLDNYEEALKMHFASLKIKEERGDKKGIASSYNNIGIIYSIQGNYPEALKSYFASLKIKEDIGDKKGIAFSCNNIGNVYLKQGNCAEALKNYFTSLKIREESADKKGIAYSFNNIALAQLCLNKPIEAKKYAEQALALSKKIGVKEEIKQAYINLSKADSTLGNYKQAYEDYKFFIIYRDSLINEENTLKTLQTSMQYEYEKKAMADSVKNADEQKVKDAQIKAQTAQIKQEQTQRYGLYGGLSLVLVFSGFIYNRFRVTRKQKGIIEQQKTEVETQKELADDRRMVAEEQKEVITKKNKEIIDSINYAQRIQKAMLTGDNYITTEIKSFNAEHFILFNPKDIVSGDFYWFHRHENTLYYMTADCTGHGVPGGFMSMLGINLLNEIVIERALTDPGEILNKLREEITRSLSTDEGFTRDGMDGILCKINFTNLTLEYASAHNAPYIVRENEIMRLETQKMPIGYSEIMYAFETKMFAINPEDLIYTFTDGYADQFGGPKSKKFMYKQLEGLLVSISQLPMIEQKQKLSLRINEWKADNEQIDDILVIGVKV